MIKRNSQCTKILNKMLSKEGNFRTWYAKDFVYLVGYEATARLSDLKKRYPKLFYEVKNGKFRGLKINWEQEEKIKEIREDIKNAKIRGEIKKNDK